MAKDVVPLTGSPIGTAPSRAAARLCNFATNSSDTLIEHQKWLGKTLNETVRSMSHTWIEIIGFASKRGNPQYNLELSNKRCKSVEAFIKFIAEQVDPSLVNRISYVHSAPKGEELSEGGENNNDGYWRAVEVYVFATKPPPRPKPAPAPQKQINMKWSVKGYPGYMQSVGAGQFGVAFYKFRNDETMSERIYFSPQFGVGASAADVFKWVKFLKDKGQVSIDAAKTAMNLLTDVLRKNPNALINPLTIMSVIKEIVMALVSGASVPFEYAYTSCQVFRPLSFNLLNLQTIGGASGSNGVKSRGHTHVYGKTWFTGNSGGRMFATRDLLNFDSSGKGYQFPGLGASGGALIMF